MKKCILIIVLLSVLVGYATRPYSQTSEVTQAFHLTEEATLKTLTHSQKMVQRNIEASALNIKKHQSAQHTEDASRYSTQKSSMIRDHLETVKRNEGRAFDYATQKYLQTSFPDPTQTAEIREMYNSMSEEAKQDVQTLDVLEAAEANPYDGGTFGSSGRSIIPRVQCAVALYFADIDSEPAETLQAITDAPDSACLFYWGVTTLIADHYNQTFEATKSCVPGDIAYICYADGSRQQYVCVELGNGVRSDDGTYLGWADGRNVANQNAGGINTYTCNYDPAHVWITSWQPS